MAAELGVPFLGRIPIYQPIREGGDTGVPLIISEPDSPAAARVHGGRRADGGAGVDRQLSTADDSAYRRAMNIPFIKHTLGERPRRAAARGPRVPDRRGEPLVSRRLEERAARATPGSRTCSST